MNLECLEHEQNQPVTIGVTVLETAQCYASRFMFTEMPHSDTCTTPIIRHCLLSSVIETSKECVFSCHCYDINCEIIILQDSPVLQTEIDVCELHF